jgi:hypothetical protein
MIQKRTEKKGIEGKNKKGQGGSVHLLIFDELIYSY